MDPSKAHYTLSHGQVAHVVKSEPDINVTVATSRVPTEMTVQGQRCVEVLIHRQSLVAVGRGRVGGGGHTTCC